MANIVFVVAVHVVYLLDICKEEKKKKKKIPKKIIRFEMHHASFETLPSALSFAPCRGWLINWWGVAGVVVDEEGVEVGLDGLD